MPSKLAIHKLMGNLLYRPGVLEMYEYEAYCAGTNSKSASDRNQSAVRSASHSAYEALEFGSKLGAAAVAGEEAAEGCVPCEPASAGDATLQRHVAWRWHGAVGE